jgi:uncharacterized protein (TIGR03083 family)
VSASFGTGRSAPHEGASDGPGDGAPHEAGPAGPTSPRIPPPRTTAEDDGPSPNPPPLGEEPAPPPVEAAAQETPNPEADAAGTAESKRPDTDERGPVKAGFGTEPSASSHDHEYGPKDESGYEHRLLKSLLGAWALSACSHRESAAVEEHLTGCTACAEEATRLRDAVGLLQKSDNLDLDPRLRSSVLAGCLGRRPARIPVPEWAAAYDAETARLDALLRDMGEPEWRAPVRLRWLEGDRRMEREAGVARVLGHLMVADGLVGTVIGLPDPFATLLSGEPGGSPASSASRTEAYWRSGMPDSPDQLRERWRDQAHALIRTVSFAGSGSAELAVLYKDAALPLRDAFVQRAFACWVHGQDIADAVDYPYEPPARHHLNLMIDLVVRMLPGALAERRRAGLANPPHTLVAAGSPGRTLHLEVEGGGGGNWYIPLDSPAAVVSPEKTVAHVALDETEFCRLAAGRVPPEEVAAGQEGDREAIRDVLWAAASLSSL